MPMRTAVAIDCDHDVPSFWSALGYPNFQGLSLIQNLELTNYGLQLYGKMGQGIT